MSDRKTSKQKSIILFEEFPVRRVWLEKDEKWYFSVVDVVRILTDSVNSRDYWYKMKIRVNDEEKIKLSTICRQFKLQAPDGKMRNHMTDAELVFTALAELSTRQIAETMQSKGLKENKIPAEKGGRVAKNARLELEQKTGKKVVSGNNFLSSEKRNKELI